MFQNPFTLCSCCKQKVYANANPKRMRILLSYNNRFADVAIDIFLASIKGFFHILDLA